MSLEEEKQKSKIFNKKTHYRNLKLDNKFNPPQSFQEQDEREMVDYQKKIIFDKTYLKVMNDWQLNLANKKKKKAITKTNFENYVKVYLIFLAFFNRLNQIQLQKSLFCIIHKNKS